MYASFIHIVCSLSLLFTSTLAITAKDTSKAAAPEVTTTPAAKTLQEEHHEAKTELKKMLDGKSPTEIAALRDKVNAGAGVVSTAVSGAVTAVAAVSKLVAPTWAACPDGFASQQSLNGCCTSSALRHLKQAKLLCEADQGWQTAQASSESFTCCPQAAPAAAAQSSGKEKEVADLKKQVAELKVLMDKKTSNHAHAPSNSTGKVDDTVKEKAITALTKPDKNLAKKLVEKEIKHTIEGLKPHHNFHKETEFEQLSQKEFEAELHSLEHPDKEQVPGHSHRRATQQAEGGSHLPLVLLIALVAVLWYYYSPSKYRDMRHVQVPGVGSVGTDNLFSSKKDGECSDLFGDGHGSTSYGGATMKPMKNPTSSEYYDDLGVL